MNRGPKGKWVKGQSGNPVGRPRKPEIELFREALEQVEAQKGRTLLLHAVERAFQDDNVLTALLKKLLPDKLDLGIKDSASDSLERKKKLVERMSEILNKQTLQAQSLAPSAMVQVNGNGNGNGSH